MEVAIVGGGICGLSLALNLKERRIVCRVYERAPEIKPLGIGITLLPHAMREFGALSRGDALLKAGIENRDRSLSTIGAPTEIDDFTSLIVRKAQRLKVLNCKAIYRLVKGLEFAAQKRVAKAR
jgi:2-polyprenyl-6-methoxyphenol hydroxylase-like FAD-dependent oxidoreductase